MPINFDLHALRAMVIGVDLGSFAGAAQRLNRSQSAVSAQLRKLEHQAGKPLFRRDGRGLVLTNAGEQLLPYARRLVALNDEAAGDMGVKARGIAVRIGMPQDFADVLLPDVLARYSRTCPGSQIEVRSGRNFALADEVAGGRLDIALVYAERKRRQSHLLLKLPRVWIASPPHLEEVLRQRPLPLVLFDAPCLFRQAAVDVLNRANRPWRLILTTPSLAGVWAGLAAGLGVTVRTRLGVPPSLTPLTARSCLPALPPVAVELHYANEPAAPVRMLRDILLDLVRSLSIDRSPRALRIG
jgi:DNA-binding transcriptional LysR family regulator